MVSKMQSSILNFKRRVIVIELAREMLNSRLKENLNCQDLSVCSYPIILITIAICNYVSSHTGQKKLQNQVVFSLTSFSI